MCTLSRRILTGIFIFACATGGWKFGWLCESAFVNGTLLGVFLWGSLNLKGTLLHTEMRIKIWRPIFKVFCWEINPNESYAILHLSETTARSVLCWYCTTVLLTHRESLKTMGISSAHSGAFYPIILIEFVWHRLENTLNCRLESTCLFRSDDKDNCWEDNLKKWIFLKVRQEML